METFDPHPAQPPAPDWAEQEARKFDAALGTTLKCKCGTADLAYHCRLCFQDQLAAQFRRVAERQREADVNSAVDALRILKKSSLGLDVAAAIRKGAKP